MGFVKIVKNLAYFRRFQVKFKRRRECKTDFYARKRLIIVDKNKYKTPKYRFVVRITNKDIVCQVFSADLDHDVCVASAYSHELRRYGLTVGLTNYAAAYATGLLLARRVNAKYKLAYDGPAEVTGEDFHVEEAEEGAAPFRALLDVGLRRTTTGGRVFGALKGACDGGLDIPHNDRRFPGSKREGKEWTADPEVHKKYILGGHVSEYMTSLADSDEDLFKKRFSGYIAAGVKAGGLEKLYTGLHASIRKDPNKKRDAKELGSFKERKKGSAKPQEYPKKRWNKKRLSIQQRKDRIKQKLRARKVVSIHQLYADHVKAQADMAAGTTAAAPMEAEAEEAEAEE